MNEVEIEKSISRTICYFDILNYPLTLMEVWKWLDSNVYIGDVQKILTSEKLKENISSKSGFYFLKGRDFLVEQRLKRYSMADRKFKKAFKVIRILSHFPGIRAIAIYSSLSFYNSNYKSDVDLFIVTSSKRIWSCRFFVNFFLKVFRLRPTERISQDKICVSFWVTENNLDLSLVNNLQDLLYAYGTGQFLFVYDQENIATKFFAENQWLSQSMPNWFSYYTNYRKRINSFEIIKKVLENIFFLLLEKYYKKIQLFILPPKLQAMKNLDTRVVINDQMIKLHDKDRRQEMKRVFENKLNQLFCDIK